ncbi:MAG: D-Ala-D-Ala carboxypeptidase family metallohydrolase [Solirubrobacteraceae bacterium]
MSVPLPSRRRPALRRHIQRPWTAAARRSPAARRWLDKHGYITPHFTWASYACSDGTPVPKRLRGNARRLHWALERFRHALGDLAVNVDGPYRTDAKNREVGGASLSRHVFADAADLFADQVDGWVARSKQLRSRQDVLRIADRIFKGVGNESSGTLHVDMRPGPISRFVSWTAGR